MNTMKLLWGFAGVLLFLQTWLCEAPVVNFKMGGGTYKFLNVADDASDYEIKTMS